MGNLLQQREYVVRCVQKEEKKRKTTKVECSRRQHTLHYSFPLEGKSVPVCKTFFLNTLRISEKLLRTSLEKVDATVCQMSKSKSKQDATFEAAVFDLQQVIHIPRSNESAIFYKRRLANYNLTVYSLKDRDCHCFIWNEAISKIWIL